MKWLTPQHRLDLLDQFPLYVTIANSVKAKMTCDETWDFWVKADERLRAWKELAEFAALLQPSSAAAAERVFSLVENMFGDQQRSCLNDLLETATLTRYYHRARL